MSNSSNLHKQVMGSQLLTGLLLVIFAVVHMVSIKDALYLNLGFLDWNKVVFANTNPLIGIAKLEKVIDRDEYTRNWVLGNMYWLAGQRKLATPLLKSSDVGAHMIDLSKYFYWVGKSADAQNWLNRAEALQLCLVDVWSERANQAKAGGAFDRAIYLFDEALVVPVTACDKNGYSDIYYQQGLIYRDYLNPPSWSKAKLAFTQALDIDDFSTLQIKADAYYKLASTLFFQTNDYDDQVKVLLENALIINPNHAWAHLLLGRVLYRDKEFADSEQHLLIAIELDNENWTFFFELGNLYEAEGMIEAAKTAYQKALSYSPNNSEVLLALQHLN